MKRVIAGFAILGAFLAFLASSFAEDVKATCFVATNGNDAWSGKLAAPNSPKTDGPFRTLKRARDAVREIKKRNNGLKEPVTILVRGGKYFLDDMLVLKEVDSGSREAQITYRAYPGEKPILSGGGTLSGWKPYKGEILQVSLPEA